MAYGDKKPSVALKIGSIITLRMVKFSASKFTSATSESNFAIHLGRFNVYMKHAFLGGSSMFFKNSLISPEVIWTQNNDKRLGVLPNQNQYILTRV